MQMQESERDLKGRANGILETIFVTVTVRCFCDRLFFMSSGCVVGVPSLSPLRFMVYILHYPYE